MHGLDEMLSNHSESFESHIFLFAQNMIQSAELSFKIIPSTRYFLGFMACHSNDTPYTLGDTRLLGDDKVLDVRCLRDMAKSCLVVRCGIKVEQTHVPPQNSTLVLRHLEFSMSCDISSISNSRVTTRTGSGYDSPKTARSPGIFWAVFKSSSLL